MNSNTPRYMLIEHSPRVRIACRHCRARKTRCSPQRPCEDCTRASIECKDDTVIADKIRYIGSVPQTTQPPTFGLDNVQSDFALPIPLDFLGTSGFRQLHQSLEGTVSHDEPVEDISNTMRSNDFDEINPLTHGQQRSYYNLPFSIPQSPSPFYGMVPSNEARITN
ncbi:hypothetical protein F5883DRAFT_584254, partial [Diaporthe sp. PMI_573]